MSWGCLKENEQERVVKLGGGLVYRYVGWPHRALEGWLGQRVD